MLKDANVLDPSKYYTYRDYLTWRFKERVELIKGKLFKKSPALKRIHQEVSRHHVRHLDNFLYKSSCKLYLEAEKYQLKRMFVQEDILRSHIFERLEVHVKDVFEN